MLMLMLPLSCLFDIAIAAISFDVFFITRRRCRAITLISLFFIIMLSLSSEDAMPLP